MSKLTKSIINTFKNSAINRFGSVCYSQEGEDLILDKYFNARKKGFYIDVGAFHPVRFSNTYRFYRRGWNGINIEPRPESKKLFNRVRPRDITVQVPISATKKKLFYNMYNEPALNTLSEAMVQERGAIEGYRLIRRVEMETATLAEILDAHVTQQQVIDFLTIDVEGLDLEVLESNNWDKYRPEVILYEDTKHDFYSGTKSKATEFCEKMGYQLFAKTFNTLFFKRS